MISLYVTLLIINRNSIKCLKELCRKTYQNIAGQVLTAREEKKKKINSKIKHKGKTLEKKSKLKKEIRLLVGYLVGTIFVLSGNSEHKLYLALTLFNVKRDPVILFILRGMLSPISSSPCVIKNTPKPKLLFQTVLKNWLLFKTINVYEVFFCLDC